MSVTAEAFMQTLDRAGSASTSAPESRCRPTFPIRFAMQQQINAWARRRVAAGGAPITIRIVKGANMEMERVEASLHGWPQAPFKTKPWTTPTTSACSTKACGRRTSPPCGSASPRTTSSTWPTGWSLAAERRALDQVQFEMLEGMANHQRRALFELTRSMLLYAPATPQGGLRPRHRLPDPPAGREHGSGQLPAPRLQAEGRQRRLAAARGAVPGILRANRWSARDAPPHPESAASLRLQRERPGRLWRTSSTSRTPTSSLPHNVAWAKIDRRRAGRPYGRRRHRDPPGGGWRGDLRGAPVRECLDPSRPGVVVGRYRQANEEDVARAIESARRDERRLAGDVSPRTAPRSSRQVAQEIRVSRGDLMGAALADGGKTLAESDPEVSEAVDFVEFYRRRRDGVSPDLPNLRARGKGVVAVVSALELSHRHSLWRRGGGAGGGEQRDPQAGIGRGAGGLRALPMLLARRRAAGGAAVPALFGGDGRVAAGDASGRGPRDPDRRHRHRIRHAACQAGAEPAGGDGRQERDHRHGAGRPRAGHQARAALGLQPQRAEVLGDVAADPRRGGLRGSRVQAGALRCGREPAGGIRLGPSDADGPADPPTRRGARGGAQGARAGRELGRHAEAAGAESLPLLAGRQVGRASRAASRT